MEIFKDNPTFFEVMRRNNFIIWISFIVFSSSCQCPNQLLNQRLPVSPLPFVLIGDNGTQSILQNDRVDYRAWIDNLRKNEIKVGMVWGFMAIRQKVDGSLIDERYGYVVPDICPWARTGSGVAFDGRPKYELREWNEDYWTRLKELLGYAQQKGIYILITIFDGWAKDGDWHPFNSKNGGPVPESEVVVLPDGRRALTGFFEYYDLSDPRKGVHGPYDESWCWQKKNQFFQEQFVIRLLEETCDFDNVLYEIMNEGDWVSLYYFYKYWISFIDYRCRAPLILNTVLRGKFTTHPSLFQDQRIDFISLHSSYDYNAINALMVKEFFKNPNKPIIHTEPFPAFRNGETPSVDDVRRLMWSVLLARGHFFVQDDTVFGFDPKARANNWLSVGEVLRKQIGYANRFFNNGEVEFEQMSPNNDLVNRGFALVDPGSEYVIYLPKGGIVEVDLGSTKETFNVKWFNPRMGTFTKDIPVTGGKRLRFNAPFPGDAVLYLCRSSKCQPL
jgi:hypothetical protein